MGPSFVYMPILKSRAGEFAALRALGFPRRSHILPMLDIVPPRWDFAKDAPDQSLDEHLAKMVPKIRRAWGPGYPLLVDGYLLKDAGLLASGEHPLSFLMNAARSRGVEVVPVTGVGRGDSYQRAVRAANRADQRGVCIRLEAQDLFEDRLLEQSLKEVLGLVDAEPDGADLVVDLGPITEEEEAKLARRLIRALPRLPFSLQWRSFCLAGSSFPENVSGIPPDSVGEIPRIEWTLWQVVDENRRSLSRSPCYADYAITHPTPVEVDPRTMRMSANLRYTTDSAWLILRGRNVRDYGYPQFNGLCRKLVDMDEYSGPAFSDGDAYIARCAKRTDGPGNATTWRRIGTSHHIEFVLAQLLTHYEKTRLPRYRRPN